MRKANKRCVEVVGALIKKKGKILVAQRMEKDRYGLMWEFPGGKVEKGETPQQALVREMREELGVTVKAGRLVAAYEDEVPDLKIKVGLYRCRIIKGIPNPLECNEVRWLKLKEIAKINLAPADRKAVDFLLRCSSRSPDRIVGKRRSDDSDKEDTKCRTPSENSCSQKTR